MKTRIWGLFLLMGLVSPAYAGPTCDWEAEIDPAICERLPDEIRDIVQGNNSPHPTRNCEVDEPYVYYEEKYGGRWSEMVRPLQNHYANKARNNGIVKIFDTTRRCEGPHVAVHQHITRWFCPHLLDMKCSRGKIVPM